MLLQILVMIDEVVQLWHFDFLSLYPHATRDRMKHVAINGSMLLKVGIFCI